jgi:hypothetical protein
MFASLTKTAAAAALTVGMALAGLAITPADAAMRHGGGGARGGGVHSAGVQHGSFHHGNRGYAGGNYARYGGGYGGYGGDGGYGYGYGYGYGCPLFPVAIITGGCY